MEHLLWPALWDSHSGPDATWTTGQMLCVHEKLCLHAHLPGLPQHDSHAEIFPCLSPF